MKNTNNTKKAKSEKRKIHLLCNAHLDPVWQWQWEEGVAAAISTFRTAADLCEEFDGFIFNHNESLLYKWVEEYEPQLFERIQRLVGEGKWNIIGGWYLQPDCNMPSGESLVRQIIKGRKYFMDKFGVKPGTAVNFDSFGHARGLVQILVKSGFDSYIYMRPEGSLGIIPEGDADFKWIGFDGSEVIAHKIGTSYNTPMGYAIGKIKDWMRSHKDSSLSLLPWGVGNHGGGPSRKDLDEIAQLMDSEKEKEDGFEIVHSTPLDYFNDIRANDGYMFERHEGDLNPKFVGCYTSLIRIKQKHRQLENEIYMTEKMLSMASINGLMDYPDSEMNLAQEALMMAQFHDILPGTCVQPAEEAAIRGLDYGLEIVSRLKARSFFALGDGQAVAQEGEYPILVYNPHPYTIREIIECEFMLADQNWNQDIMAAEVYHEGQLIPSQLEKEDSNIPINWRKRVVFGAELKPLQMNRFDCRMKVIPADDGQAVLGTSDKGIDPDTGSSVKSKYLKFKNHRLVVKINCETGLIDKYSIDGRDILKNGAFKPIVMVDDEDSWQMGTDAFNEVEGSFKLMSPEECGKFLGLKGSKLESVRVIEEGEVRVVVEALFKYGESAICMHYKIPRHGTEIETQLRVFWMEKDKTFKLEIPTMLNNGTYLGQVAYGVQALPDDGTEAVAQKWVGIKSDHALTIINDGIYGSDFVKEENRLRLTLLRSSAYAAHPIGDREIIPMDRFSPRMEQGERLFRFWINGGQTDERFENIELEALIRNEKPYALSTFPSGKGEEPHMSISLRDNIVQLSAFKKVENNEEYRDHYVMRLFEPTGKVRTTVIDVSNSKLNSKREHKVDLKAFEIRTLLLNPDTMDIIEANLMEEKI